MRFDRLRRRSPPANPTPIPPSPLPTPFTYERDDFCDSSVSYDSTPDSRSPLPSHPTYTRNDYIRALEARMEQMEKVPTSSFFHSYAGEFDVRSLFFLCFPLLTPLLKSLCLTHKSLVFALPFPTFRADVAGRR